MSEESNATTTVEISAPVESAPAPKKAPTREELKERGFSDSELVMAEKHSMVSKTEEKKPDVKSEPEAEVKQEGSGEVKEEAKDKRQAERRSSLPDFSMTEEQERVFLETFGKGTPQRGTYLRMKSERRARQAAEARIRELEAIVETNKVPKVEPKLEIDADGNEIDPEDKPLTTRQWKELQRKEQEERESKDNELRTQAQNVSSAIKEQEESVRAIAPDFDNVVKLSTDLIQNLDDLVPDLKTQKRIIRRFKDLQVAAVNAHKLGIDDENAADIAYELGKFHPDFGKQNGHSSDADGKPKNPDTKANGSHTPEQMKRIADNTQRRMSSASIPGSGGKRTISVEDVGLKELNAMNSDERFKFSKSYPDRYAKLMRG